MRLHAWCFSYIPALSAARAAANSAKYFSGCLCDGVGECCDPQPPPLRSPISGANDEQMNAKAVLIPALPARPTLVAVAREHVSQEASQHLHNMSACQ
jgi:hypothetical protein